jgi:malto-oligosyltrehalose trehalohydrolase
MMRSHAMPFGAELVADGVAFRLWAPSAHRVELVVDDDAPILMPRDDQGWARFVSTKAGPGSRYRFRIDGGLLVPDPASRFQPDDVHGPSEVIDPGAFVWSDVGWTGRSWGETILYELHIGTFTPEGTFRAAIGKLDHLADLGVTAVEIMPVGDFPGRRNWGYDGVLPFAPDSAYGRPEELKLLVQEAHRRGLMVFLDVVYNHFGPDGNYLPTYAGRFFTDKHATPWGKANNFDDDGADVTRRFFLHNALYWLDEFHLDGLRFDAVHAILDDSECHFLVELAETIHNRVSDRPIHLVLENAANEARYLRRDDGRPALFSGQWNDDIHHALHVLATGEGEGYYADYADRPTTHLARCLAEGFAYQGERSGHEGRAKGEPSGHLPPTAFVAFAQNHDQIGNRALGDRLGALAPPEAVRACRALILLSPQIPLLFMGEEWNAAQPFLFFCDFEDALADAVREGRRREFACFAAFRDERARSRIPDPNASGTFEASRLRWGDLDEEPYRTTLAGSRTLLHLRTREIVPRLVPGASGDNHAVVIGRHGIAARWDLGDGSRLHLLANLGPGDLPSAPRPPGRLLHSTHAQEGDVLPSWFVRWSIEDEPLSHREGA